MDRYGGITQRDIQKTRNRYKVGDTIRIHTYKVQEPESLSRMGVVRKAKIVAKYQHFAVVELACGVRESVLWVDLVGRR